jgi:hypothetical protein
MNPLSNPLEGFAPELYLTVLSEVAHADGLQPIEEALLQQQAANFGLDMESLPPMPKELGDVPWPTRVLVYRDALMLALADDGTLSSEEQQYLRELTGRLRLPTERAEAILDWVKDYSAVLDRFEGILREQ